MRDLTSEDYVSLCSPFIAKPLSPVTLLHMTTREKVEFLIEQVFELPADAQSELVESLLEMRAEHLGVYRLDDDEREALARSAEDVRLGRFASDAEVEQTFARHRGA